MQNTIIIAAFPGTGKTYCCKHNKSRLKMIDSDSSEFSWMKVNAPEGNDCGRYVKIRNPKFPENYIEHIKDNLDKVDVIFVSTHKEVLDAMDEAGLEYYLVYPADDLYTEFIGRYYIRGSSNKFIDKLADNYHEWISDLNNRSKNNEGRYRIINHNRYITYDMIHDIITDNSKLNYYRTK